MQICGVRQHHATATLLSRLRTCELPEGTALTTARADAVAVAEVLSKLKRYEATGAEGLLFWRHWCVRSLQQQAVHLYPKGAVDSRATSALRCEKVAPEHRQRRRPATQQLPMQLQWLRLEQMALLLWRRQWQMQKPLLMRL